MSSCGSCFAFWAQNLVGKTAKADCSAARLWLPRGPWLSATRGFAVAQLRSSEAHVASWQSSAENLKKSTETESTADLPKSRSPPDLALRMLGSTLAWAADLWLRAIGIL